MKITEEKVNELLTEMGYDPVILAKKGSAIGKLGVKYLQEQQDHSYTKTDNEKLLLHLKRMCSLVRTKYGNRDKEVYDMLVSAELAIMSCTKST